MDGSAKHQFDRLDRDIFALLRADGRAPVSKMADVLGVTRATIQNRLDRLLESGALLGFTVRVREDYEDGTIRAIMMIAVEGKSTTELIKRLRSYPELTALHTTNGNWDVVAEIGVDDLATFDRVLRDVRALDGVTNSETSLLLTSI